MNRRFKFAALAIALLNAGEARAQRVSVGVQAGQSTSWRANVQSDRAYGFTKGLFVTADLGELVSLQGEVNYIQKGWGEGDLLTRLTYIETPILARLTPLGYTAVRPYAIVGMGYAREFMCGIEDKQTGFITPALLGPGGTTFIDFRSRCDRDNPQRVKNDVSSLMGLGLIFDVSRFPVAFEYRRARGRNDVMNANNFPAIARPMLGWTLTAALAWRLK